MNDFLALGIHFWSPVFRGNGVFQHQRDISTSYPPRKAKPSPRNAIQRQFEYSNAMNLGAVIKIGSERKGQ